MKAINNFLLKLLNTVLTWLIHCKFADFLLSSSLRKNQKLLIDHVKVVIKSGRKYKADEKLRSLKLLNKAVMSSETNPQFILYV